MNGVEVVFMVRVVGDYGWVIKVDGLDLDRSYPYKFHAVRFNPKSSMLS